jgi:hypothetical protein
MFCRWQGKAAVRNYKLKKCDRPSEENVWQWAAMFCPDANSSRSAACRLRSLLREFPAWNKTRPGQERSLFSTVSQFPVLWLFRRDFYGRKSLPLFTRLCFAVQLFEAENRQAFFSLPRVRHGVLSATKWLSDMFRGVTTCKPSTAEDSVYAFTETPFDDAHLKTWRGHTSFTSHEIQCHVDNFSIIWMHHLSAVCCGPQCVLLSSVFQLLFPVLMVSYKHSYIPPAGHT